MICERYFKLKQNGEPGYNFYCRHPELIENYDKAIADETQTWDCHHRKEEFLSQKELKERNEYFDVPPEDLIFLTPSEHHRIDSKCKRVSEGQRGERNPMYGKHHSEEAKRKIRAAQAKKVLCVETGIIFSSIKDAYRKTGIRHISEVCHGERKIAGGYHWKFYN